MKKVVLMITVMAIILCFGLTTFATDASTSISETDKEAFVMELKSKTYDEVLDFLIDAEAMLRDGFGIDYGLFVSPVEKAEEIQSQTASMIYESLDTLTVEDFAKIFNNAFGLALYNNGEKIEGLEVIGFLYNGEAPDEGLMMEAITLMDDAYTSALDMDEPFIVSYGLVTINHVTNLPEMGHALNIFNQETGRLGGIISEINAYTQREAVYREVIKIIKGGSLEDVSQLEAYLHIAYDTVRNQSTGSVGGGGGGGGGGGAIGGGSSSAATDYTVIGLYLSDLAGTVLDASNGIPTSGKFFVNAAVVKNVETAAQGYLMIATYTKDGQFLDYHVMSGTFPYGEIVTFMTTVTNTNGEIGQIKAFVWNSPYGMIPLSNILALGTGGDDIPEDSTKISFTLDLYDGWNAAMNDITYLENEASAYASRVRIDASPEIIFNGTQQTTWTMDTFFGSNPGQIQPYPNDIYSGKVTLTNNDADSAYDVVEIEITTTAVVDTVNTDGRVTFKGSVVLPCVYNNTLTNSRNLPYLDFGREDAEYIINLTKDGKQIDNTQLNEWDVLSIINTNDTNVFDVRAMSEDHSIDASVSSVMSFGMKVQLSNGNWYQLDSRGYNVVGLKAGDTGRFYIDDYGKIVAFNDDITVEGAETESYAVILNAEANINTWNEIEIDLQILDQSGEVLEISFAEDVFIYNLNQVSGAPNIDGYFNMPEMRIETEYIQNANTFASSIIGEMIIYELDDAGKLTSIRFPQMSDEAEDLFMPYSTAMTASFNENKMLLGPTRLNENTLVFFVTNAPGNGTLSGYSVAGADPAYCRVATAAELVDGNYMYVAFDNGNGTAKAIIIYNTRGYEISPSAHVAVIESVVPTTVNGDDVFLVKYWMDGILQTATTDVDIIDIHPGNTSRGDVFQMRVIDGVIYTANKVMDYSRPYGGAAVNGVSPVAPDSDGTGFLYGAVKKMSSSGSLSLIDATGMDVGTIFGSDALSANIYVLDPNGSSNQLCMGGIGSVFVPEYITNASSIPTVQFNGMDAFDITDYSTGAGNILQRVLDYAFAYQYNGDVIDIVIYKAYTYEVR